VICPNDGIVLERAGVQTYFCPLCRCTFVLRNGRLYPPKGFPSLSPVDAEKRVLQPRTTNLVLGYPEYITIYGRERRVPREFWEFVRKSTGSDKLPPLTPEELELESDSVKIAMLKKFYERRRSSATQGSRR
jgi:hypothetical protein